MLLGGQAFFFDLHSTDAAEVFQAGLPASG